MPQSLDENLNFSNFQSNFKQILKDRIFNKTSKKKIESNFKSETNFGETSRNFQDNFSYFSKFFGFSVLNKFATFSLILTTLGALFLQTASPFTIFTIAQDTAILKTKYEERKREIESKQTDISKNLNEVTSKFLTSNTQEKNLQAEITKQKAEMDKVESQITESKIVINQIDEQVKRNEVQIEEVKKQIRLIMVEIQKQERISPFQTVLTSNSLGDAMGKMYNLSSLQTQAKNLSEKIESTQIELDRNKTQQKDFQIQLESTKNLLNSRKANAQALMEQTKGEQAKYEELLKALDDQKKEFETQQEKIGGEYLAEVKRAVDEQKQKDTIRENTLKAQELEAQKKSEAEKIKTNTATNSPAETKTSINVANNTTAVTTPSTASPSTPKTAKTTVGSSGCRFEAGGLDVAPGYFGPVTNGYVSQTFHCGHDGTDISAGLGTSLFAIANGVVVKKGAPVNCTGLSCNSGFGNYIVIQHDLPSGDTAYALYAHMQSASSKSVGQNVSKGEVVGPMGCTGYTLPYPCGVHVHFMLLADISGGISCLYGSTKCYNPQRYISQIG